MTMGCPARVTGACSTDERFTRKPALKALEFSLCMAPREEAALKRGDVG